MTMFCISLSRSLSLSLSLSLKKFFGPKRFLCRREFKLHRKVTSPFLYFFCILVLLLVVLGAEANCPGNMELINGKCYLFGKTEKFGLI